MIPNHFQCPITLETMSNPVILPCGHVFQSKAVMEWLKIRRNCPTCRTTVRSNSPIIKDTKLRTQIIESNELKLPLRLFSALRDVLDRVFPKNLVKDYIGTTPNTSPITRSQTIDFSELDESNNYYLYYYPYSPFEV